jgi:hypothetical protein
MTGEKKKEKEEGSSQAAACVGGGMLRHIGIVASRGNCQATGSCHAAFLGH